MLTRSGRRLAQYDGSYFISARRRCVRDAICNWEVPRRADAGLGMTHGFRLIDDLGLKGAVANPGLDT